MTDDRSPQMHNVAHHTPRPQYETSSAMPAFRRQQHSPSHTDPTELSSVPPRVKAVMSLPSISTFDSASRDDTMLKSLLNAPFRDKSSTMPPMPSIPLSKPVDHIGGSTCVCPQMKPLITAAAQLIRKLNESAQRHVHEVEYDEVTSPLAASLSSMQWVIDQLVAIEAHLRIGQDSLHERRFVDGTSSYKRVAPTEPGHAFDRPSTPSKRPRTNSIGATAQSPTTHSRRVSPPLRESYHDSRQSQPQHPSTTMVNRVLPSPSSSSVPTYSAGAQHAYKASSASSGQVSSTSGPSLHNAPMTSVASEYIADLQHQVTLKSLALQSLQAEHTNLLQKMHREMVKHQAIEKKSHVADQEIIELLTKSDEQAEQIKDLTSQVADLERRREEEGQNFTREKEQWGRMLDMCSRLQRKAEEDYRQLRDEHASVSEEIKWIEKENKARYQRDFKDPLDAFDGAAAMLHPEVNTDDSSQHLKQRFSPTASTAAEYRTRIDLLQSTLEEVRQQQMAFSQREVEMQKQRQSLLANIDVVLNRRPDGQASVRSAS